MRKLAKVDKTTFLLVIGIVLYCLKSFEALKNSGSVQLLSKIGVFLAIAISSVLGLGYVLKVTYLNYQARKSKHTRHSFNLVVNA